MSTVVYAPDFYLNPPKTGIPGSRFDVRQMELTAAQEVNTNIFALAILPANHYCVYIRLETDDLDSGTAATMSVGLLNHYYNEAEAAVATPGWDAGTSPALASGYNVITSATTPQAGGSYTPATSVSPTLLWGISYTKSRIIGVAFVVDPTTAVAGTIALIVGLDQP